MKLVRTKTGVNQGVQLLLTMTLKTKRNVVVTKPTLTSYGNTEHSDNLNRVKAYLELQDDDLFRKLGSIYSLESA